jgi:hypothetical protein
MLRTLSAPTRRGMFVAAAAVGVWCVLPAMPMQTSKAPGRGYGIDVPQTYHIDVPRDARIDLRERIAATRWLDVQSRGVQFATVRGGEETLPLPPSATIMGQLAGREATSAESDKAVHSFVERGRDTAPVKRLLAESFEAGSAADVQVVIKDSKR